jgi:hypothetical protein
MKIVVVHPGRAGVVEDISSMYTEGERIIGDTLQNAVLGNGLYLVVGDSSAISGQPANFKVANGRTEDEVYGPALFVRRESTADGLEYQSLSDSEAQTIVQMFEMTDGQRRLWLDTRYMYQRLGW